jgi:hypothetical protein
MGGLEADYLQSVEAREMIETGASRRKPQDETENWRLHLSLGRSVWYSR